MRRNKLEIIYDILKAVQDKGGKIKPTHLLYKSNLSHKRMKEYLDSLMEKTLIKENSEKGQKLYQITDEGFKFLQEYEKIREFSDAFGL